MIRGSPRGENVSKIDGQGVEELPGFHSHHEGDVGAIAGF